MRISPLTRFPHPVLSEETEDYKSGSFSVDVSVTESRTTGKVTISYAARLDEPSLSALMSQAKADMALFIVCRRTYYNQLHRADMGSGAIEFSRGQLRDAVTVRPLVFAAERIEGYAADNLHDEYEGRPWAFDAFDVLAIGPQVMFDVGLDKLAPMETIFNFEVLDAIPDGETRVSLEKDKIAIVTNRETNRRIFAMRGTGLGRVALLNGVYLPAVMEVLAGISEAGSPYETKRWYSVFAAKCRHLGIDPSTPDLLADGQALLRAPLNSLLRTKEFRPS